LVVATFPATSVLNPVSASRMSAEVLSITPGWFPERICELPMLNAAFPERFTCPKTSALVRNAAPPDRLIAGVAGLVGQKVLERPWMVPALPTTGVPVPPPTERKFTLSTKMPEPTPVLLIESDDAAPVAYATLSER
jgi:hypothetical protein